MNRSHLCHVLLGTLFIVFATGCGDESARDPDTATVLPAVIPAVHPAELPPGFLDAPPPGPVSATTVLSGGVLLAQEEYPDAAVVVQNGTLLGWGARGTVDMPNDSVGFDMRNRWLVPGTEAGLAAGTLPDLSAWQPGAIVDLLILDVDPRTNEVGTANIVGSIAAGEIHLPPTAQD